MLWSVNNGGGYPYPNGTDIATYVSASDFKLLDTNGDGSITMADDPYAPYYPVRKFPLLLDSDWSFARVRKPLFFNLNASCEVCTLQPNW